MSQKTGNRVVCMCSDCQAFAHYLGANEQVLNAHGGTDIFQLTPSQLRITSGADQLSCLRLTSKGLLRWYAKCCNTPVANTVSSSKVPFAGVLSCFMDHDSSGQSRHEALGPVLAHIQGKDCVGTMPDDAYKSGPVTLLLRSLRMLASAWIAGRQKPSPFFDTASGQPVAKPLVLTPAERDSLRAKCGNEAEATS